MPLLSRRRAVDPPRPQRTHTGRSLTASASVVNLADRTEAIRIAKARQAWQAEAWMYRRSLPELRYATAYLGNSAMRMKLFAGVVVSDHEVPVPVSEAGEDEKLDPALIADAKELLDDLRSGGPLAVPLLLKRLAENFEVAGECYLIGEMDAITGEIEWSVRSVNELVIKGDKYGIRYSPSESLSGGGTVGVRWLDDDAYVSRLWWPDPEFAYLADSPIQSIREQCETLLLLQKEDRALSRSRLANSGLLLLSDELSVVTPGRQNGDDTGGDDDDDPFFREFVESATTAISNEGAASSVVPIIARGPATAIQNGVKFMPLTRPLAAHNEQAKDRCIARMATGLDLPNEVLLGKADLNHWVAYQVSDDAFRHHIEPIVIVMCDALTAGYLWPRLEAKGHSTADVRKVLVWYDPTELVTHPDRSADAFQAWDRLAISDKALRTYLGFPDDDAPLPQEILIRLSTHVRSLDPALQTAILKLLDPKLDIPLEEGGTVTPQPVIDAPKAISPPTDGSAAPATGGPNAQPPPPPEAVGASGAPVSMELSAHQRFIIQAVVAASRRAKR